MTRRKALAAGMAVAVASAGLGWTLRRRSEPSGSRSGDETDPAHVVDVWGLRFDKPEGGEIALAALRGKPMVLNFWATWCPPCVQEMPLLDRFQRENPGWRVVGLAVDNSAPVRQFLVAHPVGFAIGLAGMDGVALSRTLGNNGGALPFSVIFTASGEAAQRKRGVFDWAELAALGDRR